MQYEVNEKCRYKNDCSKTLIYFQASPKVFALKHSNPKRFGGKTVVFKMTQSFKNRYLFYVAHSLQNEILSRMHHSTCT